MDEESKKKLVGYVSRYEWDMAGLSVWIDYAKIGEFADYFSENSVLVDSDPGLHAYVQVDAVCIISFHQHLRCVGRHINIVNIVARLNVHSISGL